MKSLFLLIAFVLQCPGLQLAPQQNTCGNALVEGKKTELVQYVRRRYKLPDTAPLALKKDVPVEGTCYRELTFEGKSSIKTWQLTLYLSPDQRFLTAEIFDTKLDPIEEERRKSEALMVSLAQNKGTSKGPEKAQVTIVEFSDFECPYCGKLANIMEQVLPLENDQVRVVFHHMPLPMHPWAQTAAEGAACAQLQGSNTFWAMHDQLFHHQQEITSENVKQKILAFARQSPGLNVARLQTCLDNEMSLGLVFRDMNLASANNVEATPTLFINGHRISGVKDADQLHYLITEARNESQAAEKLNTSMLSTPLLVH